MERAPSSPAGPDRDAGAAAAAGPGASPRAEGAGTPPSTGSAAQAPAELTPWVHALASELGIDVADVPTSALLRITRDVAHAITRPAGPVTTYLMGVAIARGARYESAAAQVQDLIERWDERGDSTTDGGPR